MSKDIEVYNVQNIMEALNQALAHDYSDTPAEVSAARLHACFGGVILNKLAPDWTASRRRRLAGRRAYYFSAEYLTGRMIYNNLLALGLLDKVKKAFEEEGLDFNAFEDIDDPALGNGGLGRLAACFLDSAATHNLPLDGYGLRYRYGLFKQDFRDGFQSEEADDWLRTGDPWSVRSEADAVRVDFLNQSVLAIPYDMPIIGYESGTIGTLRLWQAQALNEFDFEAFNSQQYEKAVREKNQAEDITRVLYPNDSSREGKKLRLKQQYFLASASVQDILAHYRKNNGSLNGIDEKISIQLNDTHPVVSIPELIRLLMVEGYDFDKAYDMAKKIFSYTNHTVMIEALEKWDVEMFKSVIPDIFEIILRINTRFCGELLARDYKRIHDVSIIQGSIIHMANLAVCCSRMINGVARIHSEILKQDVLKRFYELYPERFTNKTNGITQRRWLALCNPELSSFLTERIGEGWITNLDELNELKGHMSDSDVAAFNNIKLAKKTQLSEYIERKEGVYLPPDFIFDVQAKRMHEYKRQLLNAFAILDTYFGLKEGRIKEFTPSAYIFGAKSAPGYYRAKAIIKYINEISAVINNDPFMSDKMRVVFVRNYNCSYAEKMLPAADISEQISPAGTEASGTGNMKLMLNGAVTLGTFDGANVEIVEEAGTENNYIFGHSVTELNDIRKNYRPRELYDREPRIKRIVDTLKDGTFGKHPEFDELYASLLTGGSYGLPDQYYVLLELLPYLERKMEANAGYRDRISFGRKCLANTASAAKFSSDRTIKEYAEEIWHIDRV